MSRRRPFSLARHEAARADRTSLTLRGEPDHRLKAGLWPGTPRWIKTLALNVRGTEIRGLPADAGPNRWCVLYAQLLGASLTALGEPWQPWPCAFQVGRAGDPHAWWVGTHPALPGPEDPGTLWSGHMMIATSGWLADVGLAPDLVHELDIVPVWIWKQAVLEMRPAVTTQPEPTLRWRIAHPVPMPSSLEVLDPEEAARIGGLFAGHLRRQGFPENREDCWWPEDGRAPVIITELDEPTPLIP
jgi:hypothetical protein